ncbi:MAG: ATPase [Candidatus Marinimicrobia bacterium]|nr:ATPase [Candidatus Neomarinimicrobiota bacterium]
MEIEEIQSENDGVLEDLKKELAICKKKIIELNKSKFEVFHKEKLISIGQLSAGIAHEINNPLAYVRGNFSALLRYFDDFKNYITKLETVIYDTDITDKEEILQCRNSIDQYKKSVELDFIYKDIKNIENESADGFDRIKTIISSLSEFSRFEANNTVQLHNLNEAIDNTLNVVWNKIKYSADIIKDYQTDLPDVECIKNEINQVLLNIIINAAQAVSDKVGEKKGLITLKTESDEKSVRVVISDTGSGISKNLIKNIFDPFFTTKETGKGTGLGLSISYDIIVKRHYGKIWVESEEGVGAKFFIELPIKLCLNKDELD